jgi:hypothetical protein
VTTELVFALHYKMVKFLWLLSIVFGVSFAIGYEKVSFDIIFSYLIKILDFLMKLKFKNGLFVSNI